MPVRPWQMLLFGMATAGAWLPLHAQAPGSSLPVMSHPAFSAASDTSLGSQIGTLLRDPKVARAHWGVAVTESDGTPIYGYNEGQFFRPASNAKLYTTAAAMALFGPSTKLRTQAESVEAPDANGVLHGDLRLRGTGDANLSARTIPYENAAERRRKAEAARQQGVELQQRAPLWKLDALAADLARQGLKQVRGDIVGDDSLWPWEPYPNDWTIDDAVWGYGAPVSALTINDNQIDLTAVPGAAPGAPATVKLNPDIGYYKIDADVTTVAAKQPAGVRIDRSIGSHTLRLRGAVAIGSPDAEEVAVDDPAEFAALALKQALEAQGVKVEGRAVAHHRLSDNAAGFNTEARTPLPALPSTPNYSTMADLTCTANCPPFAALLLSPTLAEDVAVTLKVSQNLHAELLLRRLGKAFGEEGTSAQGARVVRQFLLNAGMDGDDFVLYDGSGLSGHDLITPRTTAQLLAYAVKQPWFAVWKAGLPVGGEDGTLASRFPDPPLKDHLFAKTGTLSETRALSGYLDCRSGKQVIFSIIVDDHTPVTSDERIAMDKIVAAIAANN